MDIIRNVNFNRDEHVTVITYCLLDFYYRLKERDQKVLLWMSWRKSLINSLVENGLIETSAQLVRQ